MQIQQMQLPYKKLALNCVGKFAFMLQMPLTIYVSKHWVSIQKVQKVHGAPGTP